ncbi:MAG: hypothetical protein ABEJ94_07880 [Halorientalis sp.]
MTPDDGIPEVDLDALLAAAEAATGSEPETVPAWTLAGRFESNGVRARRRPRNVERGREWQAAARSL